VVSEGYYQVLEEVVDLMSLKEMVEKPAET
jgi:hypothetical protein